MYSNPYGRQGWCLQGSKVKVEVYGENTRAETQVRMELQICMRDCRDYYVVVLPLRECKVSTDIVYELNIVVFALFTEHSD